MTDKLGVFICTGCGIGEALDLDALESIASGDYGADVVDTVPTVEGDDLAAINEHIAAEELSPEAMGTSLVMTASSPAKSSPSSCRTQATPRW